MTTQEIHNPLDINIAKQYIQNAAKRFKGTTIKDYDTIWDFCKGAKTSEELFTLLSMLHMANLENDISWKVESILSVINQEHLYNALPVGSKVYWQEIKATYGERKGQIWASHCRLYVNEKEAVANINSSFDIADFMFSYEKEEIKTVTIKPEWWNITQEVARCLDLKYYEMKTKDMDMFVCCWNPYSGYAGHTRDLAEKMYEDKESLKGETM